MKAEELFIGAYVMALGRIRKVKSIVKKDTGVEISFEGKNPVVVSLDEIDPIPLTAEILGKNKFSKSRLMGEQRHFTYYLAPSVSLLAIYDADFSLHIGDSARYIKYVHTLQHALRLCGIEKEITI